jgi:hypothetical protein
MGGAGDTHMREQKCIQSLARKPEGNRSLGKERGITEVTTDWIDVAQDRDQWRGLVQTSHEILEAIRA